MPLRFIFGVVYYPDVLTVVPSVVRVEALSPFLSVSWTPALNWEFAGTQVAALPWLTKFPLECFFPVIPLPPSC